MAIDPLTKRQVPVETDDTRALTYFKSVYTAFQKAQQATGGFIDRLYNIAGHIIRLRFAGSSLVPSISPALAHLAVKPGPTPALTVCLWDSVSTHTKMSPAPWQPDDYIARGEIGGYNSNRIHTVFQPGVHALSMLDTALNLGVFWVHDARQIPYYECSFPLRTILHWWMSKHARQLVHAGAVGTPLGGVLLVGKGGSGKSTTALACLDSELDYLGDDYVLLSVEPSPFVYSLYNSAKLDADHIQRLPYLASAISNQKSLDTEKALIFLHDHYPEKVKTGFAVRAILLPRVSGLSESRVKKASSAAGLRALAPSTIFQLPGAGYEAFRTMARLVNQVPSYILELGQDISQIPCVISQLLSER